MQKVAIIPGWTEGRWHTKKLRRALRQSGYHLTRNSMDADVIIAHSGGCLMIPENSHANIIMLVGLPFWPGRHPAKSLKRKVQSETKDWLWMKKSFFNIVYLMTKPVRWYKMWRAWKRFKVPQSGDNTTIIAVRNQNDHFMHPTESQILSEQQGWKQDFLSGQHDDLWINPKPYVQKLNKEINSMEKS